MAITAKKRGEALKILRLTAQECRVLPGCLDCRIYGDLLEDDVIMFEEMWSSEEDLNRHLCSDEYRKVLLVMEMALKQPEIRFDTISSSTGFETIERARSLSR